MAISQKIIKKINDKTGANALMKKCLVDSLAAVDENRQGKRVITSYINKLHKKQKSI